MVKKCHEQDIGNLLGVGGDAVRHSEEACDVLVSGTVQLHQAAGATGTGNALQLTYRTLEMSFRRHCTSQCLVFMYRTALLVIKWLVFEKLVF